MTLPLVVRRGEIGLHTPPGASALSNEAATPLLVQLKLKIVPAGVSEPPAIISVGGLRRVQRMACSRPEEIWRAVPTARVVWPSVQTRFTTELMKLVPK